MTTHTIHVYTDGACSGNPGPMGVGAVAFSQLVFANGSTETSDLVEVSEHLGPGTNQRAELLAVSAGLCAVLRAWPESRHIDVALYSDSEYAIGLLSKGWRARANQDLVADVRKTCKQFSRLRFVKVKGHSGDVHNERCDELATAAIKRGRR